MIYIYVCIELNKLVKSQGIFKEMFRLFYID